MGEIADDMINGRCCALCGCYFIKDGELYEHGYEATCEECWEDLDEEAMQIHQKSQAETI